MNPYLDDIDSFLDSWSEDYGERARRGAPVRTPTRQSSFQGRPGATVASQGQVQTAARNLDAKIETLSNSVKALETRTNTLATENDRLGAGLKKEVEERKKNVDALKKDLQQSKLLSFLLPSLTQKTIATAEGKVVVQQDDSLSTLLPFMLLMGGGSGGEGGALGDQSNLLLLALVLGKR